MDATACAIQFVYFAKSIWDTIQRYRYPESYARQIRLDYDSLLRNLSTVCDFLVTERFRHRQLDADIQVLISEAHQKLQRLEGILENVGGAGASVVSRAQLALNPSKCEKLREQAKNIDDHLHKLLVKFNCELICQQYAASGREGRSEFQARSCTNFEPTTPDISDLNFCSALSELEAGPSCPVGQSQDYSDSVNLPEFSDYRSLNFVLSKLTEQGTSFNPAHRPSVVRTGHCLSKASPMGPRRPPTKAPLSRLYRQFQKDYPKNKRSQKFTIPSKKVFKIYIISTMLSRGYRFFQHLFLPKIISESAESISRVRAGDLEGLKSLIENGHAIPSEQTRDGWGLIHNAGYYSTAEIVRYLLIGRVNCETVEVGGRNPADFAMIRSLRINATDPDRERAAAFPNARDCVSNFGFTPIHLAALDHPYSEGTKPPTLTELIELVENANNAEIRQDWSSWKKMEAKSGRAYSSSPLFREIIARFQEAATGRVKPRLDLINQPDELQGWTPLHWATYTGHRYHMETLIRAHADPTLLTDMGRNLLHQAAESGLKEVMQYALQIMNETMDLKKTGNIEHAIDINLRDTWGETPLHVAAENSADSVEQLLSKGARRDIPRKDDDGVPLHSASCANSEKEAIVRSLSGDRGRHVNMRNNRGRSPLFVFFDSIECVKILLGNGADVSVHDDGGMTVVHHAAKMGNPVLMELFFQHPTYRKGMRTNDNESVRDVAWKYSEYKPGVKELIDKYEPYSPPVSEPRSDGVGAVEQARFDYLTMIR